MRVGALIFVCLLAGCASAPRELVLVEMENATVEHTRLGLQAVQTRQIWREGRRVSLDCATVLSVDTASNTIRPEKLFVGDEIVIARTKWLVTRMEPGTDKTRARILLRSIDP